MREIMNEDIKWIIWTFQRTLSFAIVKVKIIYMDRGETKCVIAPVDSSGGITELPFYYHSCSPGDLYKTQKEALTALRKNLIKTMGNINDFLTNRIIDGSITQLHIPND